MQGIRTSHQEFMYGDGTEGGRATEVFTSLQSGSTGQDCNGHGTHVAAVVAGLTFGVAKNATLLSVRSLECMGNGTVSQVRRCSLLDLESGPIRPGTALRCLQWCHDCWEAMHAG